MGPGYFISQTWPGISLCDPYSMLSQNIMYKRSAKVDLRRASILFLLNLNCGNTVQELPICAALITQRVHNV